MNNMRKIVLLTVLAVLCLVLIACGSVDSIYFDTQPRTTYVQGQDLVLDNAVLLALKGDETEPVEISEVEISGYDKNVLGEQEVTFTYKEQSVSLKVKVIPRIAVEGASTNYFVRDTFDKTKGRIKVADDEGKIKTVNMSDASVTVEGFDASTAGKGKTVTVKYGSYSGTFTVNVYEPTKVELTSKPKKTSYYSHETTFSTTGAYFTVTAEGGAFSRMVELTANMVKNFNPGAATLDHLNTALKQTVTISYLGSETPFEISIRYSGVSLMQLRGRELADVDPANATKEQGEQAIFALQKYVDLSASEKASIDEAIVDKILNIAVTWGASAFDAAVESFSKTVTINSQYNKDDKRYQATFGIVQATHDELAADLARLKDTETPDPLITLADSLREIKEEFYETEIGEKTVDELLSKIYPKEAIDTIVNLFELMLELHDLLAPVPEDWTVETLPTYKEDIVAAVVRASSNDFGAFQGYDAIYHFVSAWREKNDYFDIIYAYYLEYEKDTFVETLWQKVPFPEPLQKIYKNLSYALSQTSNLRVGSDTTAFMYYYNETLEAAEAVKNGDNQLHIDVYNYINFDVLINNYLFLGTAEGINNIAFVFHVASLLESQTYNDLLDKYLTLLDTSLDKDYSTENEENRALAREIVALYMRFTPAERFAFLNALHCDYRYSVSDSLVFDHEVDEDGAIISYSYFTRLLFAVYRDMLSEEGFSAFTRLLQASEMYVLRTHNAQHYDGFTDKDGNVRLGFIATMEQLLADIEALSAEEKDILSVMTKRMTELYNAAKTPSTPTLDDATKDLFAELKDAVEVFFELYNYAESEEVESIHKGTYYILAFAAYERARAVASEILESDNADALYTYLYVLYTIDNYGTQKDDAAGAEFTFDSILDEMGTLFYRTILNMNAVIGSEDNELIYNAFQIYYATDMDEFLEKAYDVMLAEYRGTAATLPLADVMASLAAYRALESDPILGLYLLSASPLYFDGILHCLEANFDENTMMVVEILINVQKAHAGYVANSELKTEDIATARETFAKAIETVKAAYEALEDKTAFDESFLETYNFYLDTFENLPEEDVTPDDDGSADVKPAPGTDGNDPID